MGSSAKYIAAFLCLALPGIARAQSVGQVECPRAGDYVYLYSSMTTLDVRTTLQCGERVQITGRYDRYLGVRTAKGETGYVPVESLLLLKDQPGTKALELKAVQPARERTPYDAPVKPGESAVSAPSSPSEFALRNGGKLAFSIDSVRLKDNEKAAVRSFQESTGANNAAGTILPLASGKDVVFAQGTEFTAYVDGDMKLKKEAFQAEKANSSAAPAPPDGKPTPPGGY